MTNPVSVPRELLPCPFCGSTNIDPSGWMKGGDTQSPEFGPECEGCGATAASAADWNRRAAPVAAPSQDDVRDAERLDFMLCNHRKVVVERIPGGRLEIYVEEGFMGDKEYPSVKRRGEWRDGSEAANAIKRAAIDAAIAHQHEQEKGDE